MPGNTLLRFRRSAAQLHALAAVERTIRATDSKCRRKYLRDFTEAFQSYKRVLDFREIEGRLEGADVVLVGDYHALPVSQCYTATIVEKLVGAGRKVILGVEAVVARDQHILDEWQSGEIDSDELRSRIRFEVSWGYDWRPFRELLERARKSGASIFGLDCMPRQDMRSIRARDRHAAAKISELREANPDAVMVVLFGESHLAPNHLPLLVRDLRPEDVVVTVLQNVDSLYWLSAGEPQDLVEAVEVASDVVCVFSATPLEKYEHYRLCINRWRREGAGTADLAPSFYNLIGSLFDFLNVGLYTARSGCGRRFLVDELPEVWCVASEEQFERLLNRRMNTRSAQVRAIVERQGSWFAPERNVIVAREFRMPWAAEQAARFVHHACQGAISKPASPEDGFYLRVVEMALAFLGSKVLCPSRKLADEAEIRAEFAKTAPEVEQKGFSERAYLDLLNFVVLHKDYERRRRRYASSPKLLEMVSDLGERCRDRAVEMLGQLLGSEIYASYVRGQLSKRFLRSLFFRKLAKPGAPKRVYFETAEECHRRKG